MGFEKSCVSEGLVTIWPKTGMFASGLLWLVATMIGFFTSEVLISSKRAPRSQLKVFCFRLSLRTSFYCPL